MYATVIKNGWLGLDGKRDIRIRGTRIEAIGSLSPQPGDEVIDASDKVIYPGLVNTHHHLFQSILKGIAAGLDQGLGDWLQSVPYRHWPKFTPEMLYTAARVGFTELLRSGCTTCADHHYLYHANSSPEMEAVLFQAAEEVGIRYVLCRGGTTGRMTHKGMQKAGVEAESLEQFLMRTEAVADRYHRDDDDALFKVVVAPTTLVHSMPPAHLKEVAAFARGRGLRLHSHLLEVPFDDQVSRERYGCSAVELAAQCDWLGEDVWFAHLVNAGPEDRRLLGATGTGVSHCPISNARLGSGIAPIPEMAAAGMQVSIGVDGSGSAEGGSLIGELYATWLLHRTRLGPDATSVAQVLKWGSEEGARMLGFPSLGRLEVGAPADLLIFDLDHPRFAGVWEQAQAPILCGEPAAVERVMVNGRWSVVDGRVTALDERHLATQARDTVANLRALD
ncbi:MAG: amidohydrolase family protein [Oceanospirillaceae bacterium]|nr:amidohydrolase family protein [Oceanospirillaceae bacterium]